MTCGHDDSARELRSLGLANQREATGEGRIEEDGQQAKNKWRKLVRRLGQDPDAVV